MAPDQFARQFGLLYREVYCLAVRRTGSHERLSPETTALLLHLAQTGPLTLSELTRHFNRALSTLSAKITDLEGEGLLSRQRDDRDARRALIWLSPAGRQALADALQVLDPPTLATAAGQLDEGQRQQLLEGLRSLVSALPTRHLHHESTQHDSPV